MKKKLLIFPCNGNGLEAIGCLGDEYELLGFVDDNPQKAGKIMYGYPVLTRAAFEEYPDAQVLAVPGSPESFRIRDKIISGLGLQSNRFATVVHPRASVSPLAMLGYNTLIMAGVVLTSNCVVGNHVCILPNSVVHHDSSIGDYTLIGSGVSVAGGTTVAGNCYVGSASSIINGITVGSHTLIGMGTNVIKDIPDHSKIVGNPARFL